MVSRLRTLLMVLLMAVVALPEGVTVCLRRLVGKSGEPDCCASCCAGKSDTRVQTVLTASGCARCCLSVPVTARKVDPGQERPLAPALVAVLAPAFGPEPRPVFRAGTARPRPERPPHAVPSSLPLRI